MLDVKRFGEGSPLYRQVQANEDMTSPIRARRICRCPMRNSPRLGVAGSRRRAVDELADAGPSSHSGRGTFVRQNKLSEKLTLNSFLDAWTQKAGRFNVLVAAFGRVQAAGDLAERLRVRAGEPLVYVRRLRFQKDGLVAIDDRYMRAEHCPRLTVRDIRTSSLVDYLRNREGIGVDRGEMEIEARRANQPEAKALGIRRGQRSLSDADLPHEDERTRPDGNLGVPGRPH